MDLALIESDANHRLFSQSNVLVTIWHGVQEPDACRHLYEASLEVARRTRTGKIAALSVIMKSTGAPSTAAREALARLHEDPEGVIHRSALVFTKSGFVASIVRSVVLGVRQRSSRRDGHGVFSNPAEALDWITEGLPVPSGQPLNVHAILGEIARQASCNAMVA